MIPIQSQGNRRHETNALGHVRNQVRVQIVEYINIVSKVPKCDIIARVIIIIIIIVVVVVMAVHHAPHAGEVPCGDNYRPREYLIQ